MVRRKIPFSTQIAGAALMVGGVLYFILKPPPTSELPTPFGLPDNDE
jgi:hypothetical protein